MPKRYTRRVPNSSVIEEYFIEPATFSSSSSSSMKQLLMKETSVRVDEAKVVQKRSMMKRSSSESAMRADGSSNNGGELVKSNSSRNLTGTSTLKTYIKNRNAINIYGAMPDEFMPPLFITNQNEVRRKFLESNVPPVLKFKADQRSIKNILVNLLKIN